MTGAGESGAQAGAVAGPAEAELRDRVGGDASGLEVAAGGFGVRGGLEEGLEEGGRLFQDGEDRLLTGGLLGAGGAFFEPGDGEAGFGGEEFDGFGEAGALTLHDEGHGVAVHAAAEAVIVVVVDVEAGALFAVEGAAAFPLAAGAAELDASADEGR